MNKYNLIGVSCNEKRYGVCWEMAAYLSSQDVLYDAVTFEMSPE
jgi:hypothetical protein